jgi:hypothetical protein
MLKGMRFFPAMAIALVLGSGVYSSSYAGDDVKQPAITEAQLKEKLRFYGSFRELEVTFKQIKFFQDMEMELRSEGKLKLTRPDQVVWEIIKPSPVKVTLRGDQVKIESGTGKNAQLQNFNTRDSGSERAARGMASMAAWLNLDASALSRQYDVYSSAHGSAGTFRFVPKAAEASDFRELEMTLGSQGHLRKLLIHEASGDRLQIEFATPKVKLKK